MRNGRAGPSFKDDKSRFRDPSIKGSSLRILGEYSRILKNNDSVVFLITKNRVEYSRVIFRSILDF